MRRLVVSGAVAALASIAFAAPAAAAGSAVRTSHGDPFAACVGVGADPALGGVNNPGAEVNPHNAQLFATRYRAAFRDLGVRLRTMDAQRIDMQAVSPAPNYAYWADREPLADAS